MSDINISRQKKWSQAVNSVNSEQKSNDLETFCVPIITESWGLQKYIYNLNK
jgi:hypothetical protein